MSSISVFVAGSRRVSRLPTEVKSRIDAMVAKGFTILVGDANGADKAVQRYLAGKAYGNVIVHCMVNHCRNNLGNWPTHELVAPKGTRGSEFYAVKDRAMADAAEYGLMLWDGKSKGTINNVLNLCRAGKPVVVYVAPAKRFTTVREVDDLHDVLAQGDPDSVRRLLEHLQLGSLRVAG